MTGSPAGGGLTRPLRPILWWLQLRKVLVGELPPMLVTYTEFLIDAAAEINNDALRRDGSVHQLHCRVWCSFPPGLECGSQFRLVNIPHLHQEKESLSVKFSQFKVVELYKCLNGPFKD